jgi:branched-chain amino acid transport system substrate-binding protein
MKLKLIFVCALLAGCSKLAGLGEFQVEEQPQAATGSSELQCATHTDCSSNAQLARVGADYCSRTTHRCVSLTSQDCMTVTGTPYDPNAILIGSLFATTGDQAAANIARERSAILAISELNAVGGLLPLTGSDLSRPLAMLSCDASKDPVRAAEHLVKELEVPAIVGPNNSQNTLDVAMKVTIPGGTVTLSPQAVAGSIADLLDGDLTWQMVPSDAQRGPLLIHELETMQRDLRRARGRDLKLSIIVRDDALGRGTRASLTGLSWNGEPIADAINLGASAKIETYDDAQSEQTKLVAAHLAFAPDLIVLVGSGDAVNEIMAPLEQRWASGVRPEYVLIDSAKVPDLLALVEQRPDLAARVRGTGTTPSKESIAIDQNFLINYTTRYPDFDEASSAGVGASYDATYAIAYAIVAAQGDVTGHSIANGLRRLSSGELVELGPTHILRALGKLSNGESITAVGTYSALAWDDRGAISAGTVEIWCVELVGGKPVFVSSGLTASIPSQVLEGDNTVCPVQRGAATDNMTSAARDAGVPPSSLDAGVPNAPAGGAGPEAPNTGKPPVRDAGMPDAGSSPPTEEAEGGPRAVPCGVIECDRTRGLYCCISALRRNEMVTDDFSCEAQPRECALALRCTSDRECGNGAICCSDGHHESYCRAATSCAEQEVHFACDRPSDCEGGSVCCAHGNSLDGVFSTECSARCTPDSTGNTALVCNAQSQCGGTGGCMRSISFPTLAMCR